MPLAATQEEGEASGSYRARRRRWPVFRPNPYALTLGSTRTTRTRSGSQSTPERSQGRRKRNAAPAVKKRSRKGKRKIHEDEEERDQAKKRSLEMGDGEVSSATSSPLCQPYMPGDGKLYNRIQHPEIYEAFDAVEEEFQQKLVHQMKLPTLEYFSASTCFSGDQRLLPLRDSTRDAVFVAAKLVLGLSSCVGDKPLRWCSGFCIDWDEKCKTGIILTTAHLIRSNSPCMDHWLGRDEYARDAKVTVHLLDDTTAEGNLLYHQEHYDLAFFRVIVDQKLVLPSYNDRVSNAQKLFQLGRDENLHLRITHGRAEHLNPSLCHRHHYISLHSEDEDNKYDDGGPVIDFNANVVGMVNNSTDGSFIPSSILLKCLDLWRNHGFIPRPRLGLKFIAIKLLHSAHAEMIWRKCNSCCGLIVKEVSEGSHAEKIGIRVGDIITFVEGEQISTTIELESVLLDICKCHLGKGNDCNDKLNISIEVFHTRKFLSRVKDLTVNLSDQGEVIVRGSRPFTTTEVATG